MQLQATPFHLPMKCLLASECVNLQMKTEAKNSVLSDVQDMEDTNSSPIQGTYSSACCCDAKLVVLSININNHLHYEVDKRAVLNFLMLFA